MTDRKPESETQEFWRRLVQSVTDEMGGPLIRTHDHRKQLARCAAALAKIQLAMLPRWRRCPQCNGREDTRQPHVHEEAA